MKVIQKGHLILATLAFYVIGVSVPIAAQSTDPNFPTAVTTNEINGAIKARDIGDSRLTSYFYNFDGGQGDVFINVVTKNLTGDIDVFAAENLRPLTKMVVYADGGESETGRIIYLRKPERLVLRVEGRSPNDDPANFRIKFAGSFIALAGEKRQDNPAIANRETNPESGIRVNSVGTIVEIIPKPQPSPKAQPDAKDAVSMVNDKPKKKEPPKKEIGNSSGAATTSTIKTPVHNKSKNPASVPKPKDNNTVPKDPAAPPAARPVEVVKNEPARAETPVRKDAPEVKTVFKKPAKTKNETAEQKPTAKKPRPLPQPVSKPPDPMASIRLVVQFKDGRVIERPMSEVKKFSVDNGVLTVTATDGNTVKYSIFDVAKLTIE